MKSLLLLPVLLGAVSATLLPHSPLLDGHKKLHSSMEALLSKLQRPHLFSKELNQELHRSRQALAKRLSPFLTRSGIRVVNPSAYNSLLHHMMFQHGRSLVNESKALDGTAEMAVSRLRKANMVNQMLQLSRLQVRLSNFFHRLHSEIAHEAKNLLIAHNVHLGSDHIHFLMHITAKAIFAKQTVKEVVNEHLKVVLDKPLPAEQHKRLVEAAVDLSHKMMRRIRSELHTAVGSYLSGSVRPEATHPIFIASAVHHLNRLLNHCHRSLHSMLGHRLGHYKALEVRAFGPAAVKKVHLLVHIHRLARPIIRDHMKHVTLILHRYGHHPQHSLIHYLGTVHLRPKDEEKSPRSWYRCFLSRMNSVVRVAWLIVAVVFGGALLGTAVWAIASKCCVSKTKSVAVVKKMKAKKVTGPDYPTKLPYVSLIEEKLPSEAVA